MNIHRCPDIKRVVHSSTPKVNEVHHDFPFYSENGWHFISFFITLFIQILKPRALYVEEFSMNNNNSGPLHFLDPLAFVSSNTLGKPTGFVSHPPPTKKKKHIFQTIRRLHSDHFHTTDQIGLPVILAEFWDFGRCCQCYLRLSLCAWFP